MIANDTANYMLLKSSLKIIYRTLHNDATIDIGATGTKSLQFFLMYKRVPGIYFLNKVFKSYFFCLELGIDSILVNFYSQELI
jgi:hypothetical protein